jgi:hypothetical protein
MASDSLVEDLEEDDDAKTVPPPVGIASDMLGENMGMGQAAAIQWFRFRLNGPSTAATFGRSSRRNEDASRHAALLSPVSLISGKDVPSCDNKKSSCLFLLETPVLLQRLLARQQLGCCGRNLLEVEFLNTRLFFIPVINRFLFCRHWYHRSFWAVFSPSHQRESCYLELLNKICL